MNGVWTLGYGWTHGVQAGDEWTPQQAEWMLRVGLWQYENGVNQALKGAPTTQTQFDALVSMAYNVGVERTAASAVMKFHREGRYHRAARALMSWVKAGGRVYRGLVARRHAERLLYLSEVTINESSPVFRGPRVGYCGQRCKRRRHFHPPAKRSYRPVRNITVQ